MTQLILKVIAHHPMQRTSQLADRLDVALDEVDRQLRPHLVAGNVIEHEVIAPNGRPAMAYELSEQFKAGELGRAIMATTSRATFPAVPTFVPKATPGPGPTAAPTPAPTPAPAAASAAPATNNVPAPAGTKVDRAIACLTRHGTLATGQLRIDIGLRPGDHPAAYLRTALRTGLIKRDGDYWSLGPVQPSAPPASPAAKKDALASGATLDQRSADPAPAVVVAPTAAPVPAGYRCALWSDDILEVQRDGVTVAELEKAAGESLAAFLVRLARPWEAA
jgi:hypothetical protein